MARCNSCGKTGFGLLEVKEGKCPACRRTEGKIEASKTDEQRAADRQAKQQIINRAKTVTITTETTLDSTSARLGIVAAEVVLGMNIFKDVLTNIRDIFGGRSGVVQNTLKDARELAFEEIRVQAAELGADAVIAVDIAYNTLSTGTSTNMMIVSVTGTAVQLE